MINKIKISTFVAVLALAMMAGQAFAANLNYSSDTTINVNSRAYTIQAGSGATSVSVAATTLTVAVPSGSTFNLISNNRDLLTNDVGVAQNCSGSQNSATVTGPLTVVFTPSSTACTLPSGGGGLVSGGGGITPAADVTAPANTSIIINSGAAVTSSASVVLSLNATDVNAIQMMLSNDASFAGAVWENFSASKVWMLTSGDGAKTVYVKFKDTAGNTSATISNTITLNSASTVPAVTLTISAAIPGCVGTSGFSTVTGQSCANNNSYLSVVVTYNLGFTTLKYGSRGAAVMELQRLLNKLLNLGLVIDGRLGPKTIAVIKKWQKDNGLVADGLVGPKTKAAMKFEAER